MTKVFITTLLFLLLPIWLEASKLRGEQHATKDRVSRRLKMSTKSSKVSTAAPTKMSAALRECHATFADEWAACQDQFCKIMDTIATGSNNGDFSLTAKETQNMLDSDFITCAETFAMCVHDEGVAQAGDNMFIELNNFCDRLECVIEDCKSNMDTYQMLYALMNDMTTGGQCMTNYIAYANDCLDGNCQLGYLNCP